MTGGIFGDRWVSCKVQLVGIYLDHLWRAYFSCFMFVFVSGLVIVYYDLFRGRGGAGWSEVWYGRFVRYKSPMHSPKDIDRMGFVHSFIAVGVGISIGSFTRCEVFGIWVVDERGRGGD